MDKNIFKKHKNKTSIFPSFGGVKGGWYYGN